MDVNQIVEWLTQLSETQPWAIWLLLGTQALGSLSVAATAVVKLTKTTKDDLWVAEKRNHTVWGKVIGVLESLSVIKLK